MAKVHCSAQLSTWTICNFIESLKTKRWHSKFWSLLLSDCVCLQRAHTNKDRHELLLKEHLKRMQLYEKQNETNWPIGRKFWKLMKKAGFLPPLFLYSFIHEWGYLKSNHLFLAYVIDFRLKETRSLKTTKAASLKTAQFVWPAFYIWLSNKPVAACTACKNYN